MAKQAPGPWLVGLYSLLLVPMTSLIPEFMEHGIFLEA